MSIWVDPPTIDELNAMGASTLNAALGIAMTERTEDSLLGTMPVDERTVQPAGVVHGGASVAFAETLASWAATCAIDRSTQHAVGMEINANHVRPGSPGTLCGKATAVNIGRTTQIWEVRITNADGKLVCISRCTIAVVNIPSQYQQR